MKVLTINPGSTSTKMAVFEDRDEIFHKNIAHDANMLKQFETISDQMDYRKNLILNELKNAAINLADIDVFVGRGGGLIAMAGGVYPINDLMLAHAKVGANGIAHPAQLGPQLACELANSYHKPSFVVNPPDVDELQTVARITGIKGVYRNVHLHALNLKETAIRHAQSQGTSYEKQNYIVCHLGGGISISAHQNGRMIDGFDIAGGEGPMAPTRCGSIAVSDLLAYLTNHDIADVKSLCTKNGGFVDIMGTADALTISQQAENGHKKAKLIWDAMIYQICKSIGAMAAVLHGRVDGILLGGGMVFNKSLVNDIQTACSFIAPVFDYPGEFEMEAMAAGALRVLTGTEAPKNYTGVAAWKNDLKLLMD